VHGRLGDGSPPDTGRTIGVNSRIFIPNLLTAEKINENNASDEYIAKGF